MEGTWPESAHQKPLTVRRPTLDVLGTLEGTPTATSIRRGSATAAPSSVMSLAVVARMTSRRVP